VSRAAELAERTVAAIERGEPALGAVTAWDPAALRADAAELDAAAAGVGPPGPLRGLVIAVKDVIDVRGLPTSQGAEGLEVEIAATDAEAVRRLREAGALIVAKTRTSPFQWLPDTPPALNPLDPELLVGGSSGGPAAAVAAGLVPAAIATDTGGSIRWPAAMCGCVGVKPTYAAVSLQGVLPCSPSFDTVGPIADSTATARRLLALLVGDHSAPAERSATAAERSPASARRLAELAARLAEPARADALVGARIGVLDEPLLAIEDPRTRAHLDATRERLAGAGAAVLDLKLPLLRYAPPILMTLSLAESDELAALLRERPEVVPESIQPLVRLGAAIPPPLVARARRARVAVRDASAALFAAHDLDALLLPASIGPAPRRATPDQAAIDRASETSALASVTGQPAATLPVASDGAPVSVQLVGRPFEDDRLLDLVEALESITPSRSG
jgi:aspartyl-tRNA(Asn)/glutamyl-tRNA(Gln) amidotransferase subunit A